MNILKTRLNNLATYLTYLLNLISYLAQLPT
jgi:hypothetical protein